MSTALDILDDIETLTSIYNNPLLCQIHYTNCDILHAEWVSDGQCPGCFEQCLARLLCSPCRDNILSGKPMKHISCGYRGKGSDFFKEIVKL